MSLLPGWMNYSFGGVFNVNRMRNGVQFALISAASLIGSQGCASMRVPSQQRAIPINRGKLDASAATLAETPLSNTQSTTKSSGPAAEAIASAASASTQAAPQPSKVQKSPTPTSLAEAAADFYRRTPNYTCRMSRQERLGGILMPTEKILCRFRSRPRSIYYKWLGDTCAGRECVWSSEANDGKIVSLGGRNDFGFSGRVISISPDSFLATSRSRYRIDQCGQDQSVERLVQALQEASSPSSSKPADPSAAGIQYMGLVKPADVNRTLHHVRENVPARLNLLFSMGGVREWYFDPDTGRLVLLEGKDARGQRLEYYYFEHLFPDDALTDADFDPQLLWPKPPNRTK